MLLCLTILTAVPGYSLPSWSWCNYDSHVDAPRRVSGVEGKMHIRHVAKVMPKPK